MFFQFSPQQKVTKKVVNEPNESEEITILSLAPFSPNPKMFFDNVVLGKRAIRTLLIKNPTNCDIELIAHNLPEEMNVRLSWCQQTVGKNSEVYLDLIWTPQTEGTWRHMLHLDDGSRTQRSIPVAFKSVIPHQKNKINKNKLKSKQLPSYVSKKGKSPIHNRIKRKSPVKRPVLPNITNIPKINIDSSEDQQFCGKENVNTMFASDFQLETGIQERRNTYTVKNVTTLASSDLNSDATFNDSLERESPKKKTFIIQHENDMETKLQSLSFTLSPVVTPRNIIQDFNPNACSTDEKSFSNTTTFLQKKLRLFADQSPKLDPLIDSRDGSLNENVSSETYTKGNLSSETYVKGNVSSDSMDDFLNFQLSPVGEGHRFEPQDSFATRLNNLSGFSAKNVIEANLWSAGKPTRIGALSSIKEESLNSTLGCCSLKRKSECTFNVTPHKRANLSVSRLSDWSKKGGRALSVSRKSLGLSIKKEIENSTKIVTITKKDSNMVTIENPFLLAAVDNVDPFMTSSVYYNEEWIKDQEKTFKKWFNALLTPPTELHSNEEGHPVNVAKVWKECKQKEVEAAPTKEIISSRYHTNSRLNSLRRAAQALFKSEEIVRVLSKVALAVDNNKLTVREDKDIHLNLALQSEIMSVILSYNPLWLRIALETIYNEIIPMKSNSDLMGLSAFILERLFKDPYLLKKHKTLHSTKYSSDIKKFILKKFLILVYFLDQAKTRKLIVHDPCLFCKNAPIKESREALLKFARETLAAVGDITKYLKYMGYVVQYKQTHIHEFDYAVNCLGVDLRDGVRLTRVMEIILLKNDLTKCLRVPAISRLQKIHNMKIVFDSLEKSGFQILHEISPNDIVDGHKEKTLSFLWQIIYKFQAPLMIKSASTIQKWWRSAQVLTKRRQLNKVREEKEEAARKIQLWYRNRKLLLKLEKFIEVATLYQQYLHKNRAATTIQSYVRMYLVRTKFVSLRAAVIGIQIYAKKWLLKNYYKKRTCAAILIQSYVRMFIAKRKFQKLKYSVLFVEKKYLATKLMKVEKENFENLKYATLLLQNIYRANRLSKKIRAEFQKVKTAAITIQRWYRANKLQRIEHNNYIRLKASAIMIQRRFRATKEMKLVHFQYIQLKWAVLITQIKYRANKLARMERTKFITMRNAAIIIQCKFRAYKAMKTQYLYYNELKRTTIFIQRHFRAKIAMKKAVESYNSQKYAAIVIQRSYRAFKLMQTLRTEYQHLRRITVFVQRKSRATLLMKKELSSYQKIRNATILIQRSYRAFKLMQTLKTEYQHLRRVTVFVQRKFRATLLMKKELTSYQKIRNATILIQRSYRAFKLMQTLRIEYQHLRRVTVFVQRRFKATLLMKKELTSYQKIRSATILIQRWYRAKKQRKMFLALRKNVILIQRRFRERTKEEAAAKTIQSYFRKYIANKSRQQLLQSKVRAVIVIQKYVRRFLIRKQYAQYLTPEAVNERRILRIKCRAAVKIQACWRGYKSRSIEKPELSTIRDRMKQANKDAGSHNTFGSRYKTAIQLLCANPSLHEIIKCLEDIEFITRRSKEICFEMSCKIPKFLYATIVSTNRSLPEMQACNLTAHILINFCKYPPSRANSFVPEYMDKLMTVMLHWCDKEAPLFPTLCTLLWLFAHTEEYKEIIKKGSNFEQKVVKIEALCNRKVKMVHKATPKCDTLFSVRQDLPLPSLTPDWGLEYKNRPKVFSNSVQAFKCLMFMLKS